MKLFVDGVEKAKADISGIVGDIDASFPVVVGLDGAKQLSGTNFGLVLDELQIDRKALTPEQVKMSYAKVPSITVNQIVVNPSIRINPSGGTFQLKPVVKPSDAQNSVYTVTSSDESIAKAVLNNDGTVTVNGYASGEAVLTFGSVDGSGVTAQTIVRVMKEVSMDVNGDGLLNEGDINEINSHIGSSSTDPNWALTSKYDLNSDGRVDEDVEIAFQKINEYNVFPYKRVILIGTDGMGNFIEQIDTPNIHSLIDGDDKHSLLHILHSVLRCLLL